MRSNHFRREEAAALEAELYRLRHWQVELERVGKKPALVAPRTWEYITYEAVRRTAIRRARDRTAPFVLPEDVLDEMVMRLQDQLTLPYISKRRYRQRRGY